MENKKNARRPPNAAVPEALPAPPPAVTGESGRENTPGPERATDSAAAEGTTLPFPASGGKTDLPGLAEEAPTRESIPLYSENPEPEYPRLARERGWEGEVLLQLRIGATGTVLQAEVERSSGHVVLDRAAVRGVQRWRFEPARRGDVAVESTVLVPIPFILERN